MAPHTPPHHTQDQLNQTNQDTVVLDVRERELLKELLDEQPELEHALLDSATSDEARERLRQLALESLVGNTAAMAYYRGERAGRAAFRELTWQDYAAIRLLDYADNAGRELVDRNFGTETLVLDPVRILWLAVTRGAGGANVDFVEDMLHLFRQFTGKELRKRPPPETVTDWMARHPSGLDERVVALRRENRDRIIDVLIRKIDEGAIDHDTFTYEPGLRLEEKRRRCLAWWDNPRFHLACAVRDPRVLNEMLGMSLAPETLAVLHDAEEAGIPFFVNPYYLSLLNVDPPDFAVGADLAIRQYVLYSREVVEAFGHIVAWEKEDLVRPGKPNAAGWLLPEGHNIHRRYPDVAILIPDTRGRACGGLCASCQRMYGFQRGQLNFDLDHLVPDESWDEKLTELMDYFEHDSQLCDILITGGDALMSSDRSLRKLLNAVCSMARRKIEANKARADGDKYAEIVRVRLGSRLPVYLPQRVTPELAKILADFREKAATVGVKQFVLQTHFESPMEVTPEAQHAVRRIKDAGWLVTNQHVFTAAASRRGHAARLRQVLKNIGVLPYYTFSVKGYKENSHSFATNARALQEQTEEKAIGRVPRADWEALRNLPVSPPELPATIARLCDKAGTPFLATDRSVLNLPGVGKSLTFRVIGITPDGRRVLAFDHDHTRAHSPVVDRMGKVVIVESKSISAYLQQLEQMGEDPGEYSSLWGYSIGETEPRAPLYEYPEYYFEITPELTNIVL